MHRTRQSDLRSPPKTAQTPVIGPVSIGPALGEKLAPRDPGKQVPACSIRGLVLVIFVPRRHFDRHTFARVIGMIMPKWSRPPGARH